MIRRNSERQSVSHPAAFGGEGHYFRRDILNCPEEFYGKGRVYSHMTLPPGCTVGYHEHHGDAEVYYFLKGHGQFNDNGNVVDIHPGDVAVTFEGQGHGMVNNGDEDMEFIAMIYYK